MQNKLKKEDAFTRLNVAKIKSEWRDILRRIKCKQLLEDLKAIKKECDESIQRKNAVIRRLLSDLDESEEIYSTMLHSHMNIIEKLIGERFFKFPRLAHHRVTFPPHDLLNPLLFHHLAYRVNNFFHIHFLFPHRSHRQRSPRVLAQELRHGKAQDIADVRERHD